MVKYQLPISRLKPKKNQSDFQPKKSSPLWGSSALAENPSIVPCCGNEVTLPSARVLSDHEIRDLLIENQERPVSERISHRDGHVLRDLRKILSLHGEWHLTQAQTEYLEAIVDKIEGTEPSKLSLGEKEERQRKISAYNEYRRFGEKDPLHVEIVSAIVGKEIISAVIAEVAEILKPYGLAQDAEGYVVEYARSSFRLIDDNLAPIPPKQRARYLFSRGFNPDTMGNFIDCLRPMIVDYPEMVAKVLDELISPNEACIKENITYLALEGPGSSISAFQGGSPGSAQGGNKR